MQSVSAAQVNRQVVPVPSHAKVPQLVWLGAGQAPLVQLATPVAVQMPLVQVQEAVTQTAVG
jgi:hypothetical protein